MTGWSGQADGAATTGWGRRYLMCPPDHFEVAYAINPWMGGRVDHDLARDQWRSLVATMRLAGADVEIIPPVEGLPDMVFTANAGLVDGSTFIAGAMRHAERRPETTRFIEHFSAAGYLVRRLSDGALLEGLGDMMPLRDSAGVQLLVAGHGARSSVAAHADVAEVTGVEVLPVRLDDLRWYHVDLTLCPLADGRAIVYPDAYDAAGARAVMARLHEPLVLDGEEAATFAANSIVVGRTVIMPACPPRVGRQLEAWGYDVVVVDVSEFLKAGGAVRCLTLPLDTTLTEIADDRIMETA